MAAVSLQECAAAAVATWPWVMVQTPAGAYPAPVVMTAIGGAESGWHLQPCGIVGPCDPSYSTTYNCKGRNAAGWLQVELVHGACVQALGGGSTPCEWFDWLSASAANCALAARQCLTGQVPTASSLSAWTTFTGGQWVSYLPQAQAACQAARGTTGTQPPTTPPTQQAPRMTTGQVVTAIVVAAALGGGVWLVWRRAHEQPGAQSA